MLESSVDIIYSGIISLLFSVIHWFLNFCFVDHFWIMIPFAVSFFCSLILLITRFLLVSHYAKQ